MTKEYELIHKVEYGVHYKKWVRIRARAQYCGCEVFLVRYPYGTSVISELSTGASVARGKISPYPAAIVAFLDKTLTEAQRAHLHRLSGRLGAAYRYKRLRGLPTYKQAKQAILAKREELFKLEETIIGGGIPF